MFTRVPGDLDWKNTQGQLLDFARLPALNEFIALEYPASTWHRVELVLHIACPAEYIAEIYCENADMVEVLQATVGAG